MKIWLLLLVAMGAIVSRGADLEALKAELVKTETEFCALAAKEGVPAAFRTYIAPDGFFLGVGPGARGIAVVNRQYASYKPGATLVWKPLVVDVAASGELGYTTGTYEQRTPGDNGAPPVVVTGRYITIWKKQPDGSWKFAVDGGTADKPARKE